MAVPDTLNHLKQKLDNDQEWQKKVAQKCSQPVFIGFRAKRDDVLAYYYSNITGNFASFLVPQPYWVRASIAPPFKADATA